MDLYEIMTIKEAAEKWQLDTSTLRKACGVYHMFKKNECRKSGGTWLITRSGMERVYGKLTVENLGKRADS